MEKFALIPKSQMDNPNNWVCYCLKDELEEILELESDCYPQTVMDISKRKASGELLDEYELKIRSCATGRRKTFVIYELVIDADLFRYFNLR